MDKQFIYYSDGKLEEVSAEVFKALVESDNKIRYFEHDLKVDRTARRGGELERIPSREDSLERLMDLHIQFADNTVDVAAGIEHTLMLNKLRQCFTLLDEAELELIQTLYFEGYTEREYAEITGVFRNAIHKRKTRILEKLKKLLGF